MRIGLEWCIAIAVSASLVAGCASTPRAVAYVAPKAGTTWVNQVSDTGSYGSGTRDVAGRAGEREWEGQRLLTFESSLGTLLANPQTGHWIAQLTPAGQPALSWSPPVGFEWPLEAGKAYTFKAQLKLHAQNQVIPFEEKHVVEAYEDISVPAGTFKAYRVRTTSTLGSENVFWYAPDVGFFVKQVLVRTDKSPSGAGQRISELKVLNRP